MDVLLQHGNGNPGQGEYFSGKKGGGATSLCLKRVTVTKATLQSSTDVVVVDLLCAIQVGGPRLTGKTTRFLTHNGSVGKKMGVRPS